MYERQDLVKAQQLADLSDSDIDVYKLAEMLYNKRMIQEQERRD